MDINGFERLLTEQSRDEQQQQQQQAISSWPAKCTMTPSFKVTMLPLVSREKIFKQCAKCRGHANSMKQAYVAICSRYAFIKCANLVLC
ncbi:hypothetical protein PoB_005415600 [Plakobranchus ocellatus]|uniref:Uncharacterized protein n=1 Tax=Plakobranchus ocellatus TaxID=259542 RepID=A0AAV4C4J6_9GAST|nr:hypothetical protein PoB_005415600 [Plakobranchus ocellatus]